MKTRRLLYATLSFLAVNIGICPNVGAASTLQLTQTPHEISGTDSESGVAFRSSLLPGDHVIIDLYIGTKRIHEEVDHARQTFRLSTASQGNETPVALSVQDILAIQSVSLFSLPPKIHTAGRHGDALGRLLNLISDAPAGAVIDITSGPSRMSFTSICPQIGGLGLATYTLGILGKCYQNPALGRVAAAAATLQSLVSSNLLPRNVLITMYVATKQRDRPQYVAQTVFRHST